MDNENKVVAIVVTYNPALEKLRVLIDSIMPQVYKVIVVDNGSSNSKEIYELFSNYCCVIQLDDNYGIATAQNVGIKESFKLNASHVLLFDQDTLPPSELVNQLLFEEHTLLEQGCKVGAIGPSFYDGRTKVIYPVAMIQGFSLRKIYPDKHSKPISVSFIIASGTLIRTSVLNDVGLMLESLFIDYVDIEWCLRAISIGYDVYVAPDVKIIHEIGDLRKRIFKTEMSSHNHIRCYYISRNGFIISRLSTVPMMFKLRTLTYTVIRNVITASIGVNSYKNIIFSILGVYHGIINRSGKLKKQ